jgi:DNA-binding MarR family transcriptional regulator
MGGVNDHLTSDDTAPGHPAGQSQPAGQSRTDDIAPDHATTQNRPDETAPGHPATQGRADETGRGDPADPTEQSRWRPLFHLLADLDREIARVYADNGIVDLKANWVPVIIRLDARGPMTITELARSMDHTHSAMSQKVAAMRAAGWLDTSPGPDARSKKVSLTPKAERVAAKLAAEWRATEASLAEIEAELPYPLSRAVQDVRAVLARKSVHDRIAGKLAGHPQWRNP